LLNDIANNTGGTIEKPVDPVVTEPNLTPNVPGVDVATGVVVPSISIELLPAGMVTVVGKVALDVDDDNVIGSPAAGAFAPIVTTTESASPPVTDVESNTMLLIVVGVSVSVVENVVAPWPAVIFELEGDPEADDCTTKVVEV
jgi:hypothetical protein